MTPHRLAQRATNPPTLSRLHPIHPARPLLVLQRVPYPGPVLAHASLSAACNAEGFTRIQSISSWIRAPSAAHRFCSDQTHSEGAGRIEVNRCDWQRLPFYLFSTGKTSLSYRALSKRGPQESGRRGKHSDGRKVAGKGKGQGRKCVSRGSRKCGGTSMGRGRCGGRFVGHHGGCCPDILFEAISRPRPASSPERHHIPSGPRAEVGAVLASGDCRMSWGWSGARVGPRPGPDRLWLCGGHRRVLRAGRPAGRPLVAEPPVPTCASPFSPHVSFSLAATSNFENARCMPARNRRFKLPLTVIQFLKW